MFLLKIFATEGLACFDLHACCSTAPGSWFSGRPSFQTMLATGLMIIAVGKATKLFPFLSKANKTYRGQIRLGFSTDTYDSTGNRTSPEKKEYPDCEILKKNMKKFVGEIKQVPPLYSAKKYKGRPLYELARRNEKIVPKPIQISVLTFQLMDYHPPEFLKFNFFIKII